MRKPAGYSLGKSVGSGARAELHFAIHEDSGHAVVLKAHLGPRGDELARAELAALRRCAGAGVVRAIDLDESATPPLLILDRLDGCTLEQWVREARPDLESVLGVAISLCAALERIHDARVLHGNLQPAHALVDPASGEASLISFSLAHEFGAAQPARPLDTLRYGAPEHSGRMGRGADFRSDLYALGGTLYFALTGRPPFDDDDPLALLHAHVARRAPSLLELRPELPPTLERVVRKLLEKDPDARYQTATALRIDLVQCLDQLRHTGRIDDELPLGTADVPQRPMFPRRLYGRDAEVSALEDAYRAITRGGSQFWLISGPPGVGKTALIDELRGPLMETGGHLARGKFDLYRRDRPYHGIASALDHWTQQLLTESEARLHEWRDRLRGELGDLAAVAAELVPDLGIVLGDVASAPRVGPREARARLALCLQRLVRAMARRAHPLLIVLDDLQWADPGSLYLIEELVSTRAPEALLIAGSYRDGELDPAHPLHALIERLAALGATPRTVGLGAIPLEASTAMLAEALGHPAERVRTLALYAARKTGNVPLLIQHFIEHLHALELLRYRIGEGWVWVDAEVESADIPEEAVELMTAKLEALDATARSVLELASCVGDEFSADLLEQLGGGDREKLDRALFSLGETGLIAPCRAGFRFAHDRIREAAQALIDTERRESLHQAAARILLGGLSEAELAERAFEVGDHVVRAGARIPAEERSRAVDVCVQAGRRALASGTAATAETYLAAGRALFSDALLDSHLALGVKLFLASAEAAGFGDRLDEALAHLDRIEGRPLGELQRLELRVLRMKLLAAGPDTGRAIDYLLAHLRLYGVRWPRHPSRLRVALAMRRSEQVMCSRTGRGLPDPSTQSDALAALQLLNAVGGAMYRYDVRMAKLAVATALQLVGRLGIDPLMAPYLVAVYAVNRRASGDRELALYYGDVALEGAARRIDPTRDPRAEHVVHSLVYPWYRPRRASIGPLEQSVERLREAGDLEFASAAAAAAMRFRLLGGDALSLCGERCQTLLEERVGSREMLLRFQQLLRTAEGDAPVEGLGDLPVAPSGPEDSAELYAHVSELACEMLVLCVHGRFETAWERFERVGGHLLRVAPAPTVGDAFLFRGLCASALLAEPGRRRLRLRAVLRQSARRLRALASAGSDFEHMAEFLAAERAARRRDSAPARARLARVARRAEDRGFRHHAALARERLAALLLDARRELEAAAELREAARLYREWGARGKARDLLARLAPSS